VNFLIDAMLPPSAADALTASGHDATTPERLGAHNLADDVLVQIATGGGLVIVTENARDFAHVSTCPVLFVRKSWWPSSTLAMRLAQAVGRWATSTPDPGPWPHWLPSHLR